VLSRASKPTVIAALDVTVVASNRVPDVAGRIVTVGLVRYVVVLVAIITPGHVGVSGHRCCLDYCRFYALVCAS